MRAAGIDVDDDDKPAPENIPTLDNKKSTTKAPIQDKWGYSGVCYRQQKGAVNI